MTEWLPPAVTPEQFERLTAIEAGFPAYLRRHVVSWVMECSRTASGYFIPEVTEKLSLRLKTALPSFDYEFQSILEDADPSFIANVIDAMLFFNLGDAAKYADALETILDDGRSEWAVVSIDGTPRLTARISPGVLIAYSDVVSKTALAGRLLTEAFEAAYGSSPNPNHAYDLCVKAVETIACPAFIPKNTTRASLGAVISHLEQKAVSLPLIEKHANHGETITKMMRLLWEGGQRHGDGSYQHISLEGARTAQALAFSLVAMIHEQLIAVA